MQAIVEELLLSGSGISPAHGEVYELLGLDVIYDRESLKIYSTRKAKIKSISSGIHVHAHYGAMYRLMTRGFVSVDGHKMPLEIMDMMGNMIIVTFVGRENVNRIAIVTSGGDASGMNSAIKSIIRTGIKWGASMYGVYNGYDGLINNNIRRLSWDTETYHSSQGGTVLLSARSTRFMEKEGRKQAVLNLMKKRINCMIILGGDGSLKGALALREEFKDHFRSLVSEGRISVEEMRRMRSSVSRAINDGSDREQTTTDGSWVGYSDFYGKPEGYKANPTIYHDLNSVDEDDSDDDYESPDVNDTSDVDVEECIYDLKVVAIPASIDNDIYGAAISLGEDTAIHRVTEAIDHLMSTMRSHSRTFVIEVMGRKCGWIALMSALASAADYVLLPEVPPTDWKREVIEVLKIGRKHGRPGAFVVVAEGAVEEDGTPISASEVVSEIDRCGIEVRLLRLGHIQRGGPTSAQDRIYGTLLGIKAVEMMLDSIREPVMISIFKDEFEEIDLREVVEKNELIKRLQEERRFEEVMGYRSHFFRLACSYFKKSLMNRIEEERDMGSIGCKKIGILQSGHRSSGMNTALNAIVQYSLAIGMEPYYIPNGFEGLIGNQVISARLYEFSRDVNNGGSAIGVGDNQDVDMTMLQKGIDCSSLDSLIVIGDSKALVIIEKIKNINVVFIPASSYNNIPGNDRSIGSDTALNTILKMSDISKLNSFACKNNVFVIEIGGEHCGYLSLMGGIAAGAFEVFIPERKYLIGHLSEAAQRLRSRFNEKPRRGIVIFRNEKTFCSMSTGSFCKALKTDSEGLFETDYSILGQLQQGSNPSPIDRINATILGIEAVDLCCNDCGIGVVGFQGDVIRFIPIHEVLDDFDQKYNRMKDPDWLKYSNICRSVE